MSSSDLATPATASPTTQPEPPHATAWERFWFTPASAWSYRLAVALVFVLASLALLESRGPQLRDLATAAPERWQPVGIFLLLPQPRGEWLVTLVLVAAVACGVAAVANRPWLLRVTGPVAAYLVGFGNNFGKVNHGRNVLVIALLVLAIGAYRSSGLAQRDWRFRWPVAAARSGIALMFLFAALSKLRGVGLDWVASENMRNILVMETTLLRDVWLGDVGAWIAAEPWRWQLAALGSLVGEGLLVVGLLARRTWLRVALKCNAIAVLLGLNALLDLGGWVVLALALVLFDLDRLAAETPRTRRIVTVVLAGTGVAVAVVSWVIAFGWLANAVAAVVLAYTAVACWVVGTGQSGSSP